MPTKRCMWWVYRCPYRTNQFAACTSTSMLQSRRCACALASDTAHLHSSSNNLLRNIQADSFAQALDLGPIVLHQHRAFGSLVAIQGQKLGKELVQDLRNEEAVPQVPAAGLS